MGIVLEDVLVAGFNTSDAGRDGGAGRDVLVGGLGGDNIDAGGGKSEFEEFAIVKTTDGTLPDGTETRIDPVASGDVFDFKLTEGGEVPAGTHLPSVTDMVIDSFDTGRLLIGNGGDGGWLFGNGGDGGSGAASYGLYYVCGEDDLATFQPDINGGHIGGAGGLFFGTGGAGGDGIPVTMAEYGLMIA